MLVSQRMTFQRDRESVDDAAKRLVLGSYREGCRKNVQSPFDTALDSYLARYPHVSRELAGHAVAYILATAGL